MADQNQQSNSLRKSEARWNSLVENSPQGIIIIADGVIDYVNQSALDLVGESDRNNVIGTSVQKYVPEAYHRKVQNRMKKVLQGEQADPLEIELITKTGKPRYVRTHPVLIEYEDDYAILSILDDITELKEKQKKLEQSEKKWEELVKQNPQPIQITQDAKITFINQAGVELYGAESKEELIGRSVYEFSDPEKIEDIEQRKNRLENGKSVDQVFEHKINCLNGDERYVHIYSIPTKFEDKSTIQSVFYDVTEQKKKERRIKDSLDEKRTLLKEIHHRVKNNLAVISGLLELQVMNTDDNATINILRDSQQRIKSMAMIHEKLYESEALADIGFDRYLRELVESIRQTYKSDNYNVDINFDLDAVSIDLEQAIPCSLIVNEVVVNCFKHAFTPKEQGHITITSEYTKPGLKIVIEDNGCGLPEDFNFSDQNTLGMSLIQTLSMQLDGEVSFATPERSTGTVFKLFFEVA